MVMRRARRLAPWGAAAVLLLLSAGACGAQTPALPALPQSWTSDQPEQIVLTLRILLGLTVLSLAPALLLTLTSFTRIVIVLSFLRSALGTQQTPPNAVLGADPDATIRGWRIDEEDVDRARRSRVSQMAHRRTGVRIVRHR